MKLPGVLNGQRTLPRLAPVQNLHEFTEAPWNTETDKNKILRRYASMMRQSLMFQLVSCLGIS